MSVMDETLLANGVLFVDQTVPGTGGETAAYRDNERRVHTENIDAGRVTPEDLAAFLELVYAADAEYMDVQDYVPEPGNMIDWDDVSSALLASQKVMAAMQELLSQTLEDMGIEDHSSIRVYSDQEGALRLIVDHPRQEAIEEMLNSPGQRHLRDMYASAAAGMTIAGSLVGTMSVPEGVLEMAREKREAV
ncbi:MAG: hypothetical protein LBS30_07060 [Planctomycetota bacterium]|jgi:hypothetical protein|nr:hypothetical protein [Planctomycetota bacterium]